MKCPNCGAEVKGNVCEFCGSELLTEKKTGFCCGKCGSSNVAFRRENQGEIRGKKSKQIVHKTVGYCKDCGNTWFVSEEGKKKRKTWLWVLGWIFIFPLPLTILLLRKKDMKPVIKYGIIVVAWLIFLLIGLSGRSDSNSAGRQSGRNREITQNDVTQNNIKELSFLSTDDVTLKVGEVYSSSYIKADVKRTSKFSPDDIVFISDNPEVATISLTRVSLSTYLYYEITGVSPGETKVYVTSSDGSIVSEAIHVTVLEPVQIESITIIDAESDLVLGEFLDCSVEIVPENAEDKAISWSSSDETVLQVDENGVIYAVGSGTAIVTATANNGITSSIEINVDGTKRVMNLRVDWKRKDDENIGDDWSHVFEINGNPVSRSYVLSVNDAIKFFTKFTESDDNPDVGKATADYKVSEKDLDEGFTVSIDVYVTENGGQNSGKRAHFIVDFVYSPN